MRSYPNSQQFTGTFFRLRFPIPWEEEIIEDIACFFRRDMGGAVQIAAMRSPTGAFDLKQEMLRYFRQNEIDLSEIQIYEYTNEQGLQVLSSEYWTDGRFWIAQVIGRDDKMLLALYNDEEAPNDYLAREIADILSSIEFI